MIVVSSISHIQKKEMNAGGWWRIFLVNKQYVRSINSVHKHSDCTFPRLRRECVKQITASAKNRTLDLIVRHAWQHLAEAIDGFVQEDSAGYGETK